MKRIPFEEWRDLSVQERNERLAELNSRPSLFQLLIMVILKKLENKKSRPPLVDKTVFKGRRRIF